VASFGAGGRTPVDPEVLMTLARACRDEVEAGFDYPSGAEVRRRRVEPYRLVASDRRWYLFAFDLDRDGWRSFRVDRMTEVSARTWRFRPRAAGLDKPVEFEPSATPDSTAIVGDTSTVKPDSAAPRPDTTHVPPDTASKRPGVPLFEVPELEAAEIDARGAAARGYFVQFAAMPSEREACIELRALRLTDGVTPAVVPSTRSGKVVYRIVAGPFATRAQADRVGRASGHEYFLYGGAP